MQKKFLTGMMLGAVVAMFLMPEMDRGTKRKMRRTARNVKCAAEGAYENMRRMMN